MIRILHSVSNMDRAGIETMLMNYYRHIDRSKIQFDFLCNKKKPGAYDAEIKEMGGSPVGVEWLYLAWASDKNLAEQCTIKECRASTGNRFGICLFEINSANKDEKIIDLTLADEMTYEDINTQLENSGKVYLSRRYERSMKKGRVVIPTENEINEMKAEISLWALHTYLKLLSEQIFTPLADADDKSLMYAPFQCMAQYFLNKGYVGIKYKSTVCTGAKDIVLFDKTMATPVGPIQDFII